MMWVREEAPPAEAPAPYFLINRKAAAEMGVTDPADRQFSAFEVWNQYVPGTPFSYDFFDTAYGGNYQAERRMGSEFMVF